MASTSFTASLLRRQPVTAFAHSKVALALGAARVLEQSPNIHLSVCVHNLFRFQIHEDDAHPSRWPWLSQKFPIPGDRIATVTDEDVGDAPDGRIPPVPFCHDAPDLCRADQISTVRLKKQ